MTTKFCKQDQTILLTNHTLWELTFATPTDIKQFLDQQLQYYYKTSTVLGDYRIGETQTHADIYHADTSDSKEDAKMEMHVYSHITRL